jgi:lipoprotein NlpI
MGVMYLQSHKYSIASEYVRAVLEVYPWDIDSHLLSGIIFYLQGYYNAARYEFDVLEELDPQNTAAKLWHALIELEEHHPMNAEKYVNTLTASVTEKIGSPGTAVMASKMSWNQGAFLCDDSGTVGVGEESRWTTAFRCR